MTDELHRDHHHRDHHGHGHGHGRHHHPIHSGDWHDHVHDHSSTTNITNNTTNAPPQDALEGCLSLLRGIGRVEACEATVGHLIAALSHSGHIRGLVRAIELANVHMNHYTSQIARRDY